MIPQNGLVRDVSDETRNNIYDFLDNSRKCIFIVDCENSDPYNLCAALNGLDEDKLSKIGKIILFDDEKAASAWNMLRNHIDVEVEYVLIERIKENKSLTDIRVTACACREFYKNDVDSIVLVSSDSDYWGLIKELPDAKFMAMVEHKKTSGIFKESLQNEGIFYCYLDDFDAAKAAGLRERALEIGMAEELRDRFSMDLRAVMNDVLNKTRISMSEEETEYYISNTVIPRLTLNVDDDRNLTLEFRRK